MRKHYLLLLLIMLCSTFSASAQTKIASEYCGEIAPPKVDHEYCSPIINWTTAENGDVVITLKAGAG